VGGGDAVSGSLFHKDSLDTAIDELKKDILGEQISTIRNYNFAILPYRPSDEFKLRRRVRRLTDELVAAGWLVLPIDLHALLLARIRALGEGQFAALAGREKRLYEKDPTRALNHLREKISPHVEGPDGIARDVARLIAAFDDEHPHDERKLVLIGRAGALYPFFRSSALLKHIDGKTRNLPVVLLYPGERKDRSALSFMGELAADRDYRPRIYP
jgi:hypothetical protein